MVLVHLLCDMVKSDMSVQSEKLIVMLEGNVGKTKINKPFLKGLYEILMDNLLNFIIQGFFN